MFQFGRVSRAVAAWFIRALTLAAAVFVAACSDTTEPAGSGDPETVEIAFARDIGNPALAVIDTVTMIAVVRDKRGNPVSGATVDWRLVYEPATQSPHLVGTITPTGPLTALLKLNFERATILAGASRSDQFTVWGRLAVVLGPPQVDMFIWSRESGLTRIPAPAGGLVQAHAINNHGEVVGTVTFPFPQWQRRAFVWSASTGYVYLSEATSTGLNTATGINDAGTVTGWTTVNSSSTAYVWTRGSGLTMVSPGGWTFSARTSINASGQIAGDVGFKAFRWTPQGGVQFLPVDPGNPHSYAIALNDAGDVIGYDGYWDEYDPTLGRPTPILWTAAGERIEIANCNRQCNAQVGAINGRGQVAGTLDGRPFRWSVSDGFTRLSIDSASARGMNEAGDVVLAFYTDQKWSGSVWLASGELTKISLPGGTHWIQPTDINDKGQVVGYVR